MPWLETSLVFCAAALWVSSCQSTAAQQEKKKKSHKSDAADSWRVPPFFSCSDFFLGTCISQTATVHHGAGETNGLYSHCHGPWHRVSGRPKKKTTDATGQRQMRWGGGAKDERHKRKIDGYLLWEKTERRKAATLSIRRLGYSLCCPEEQRKRWVTAHTWAGRGQ